MSDNSEYTNQDHILWIAKELHKHDEKRFEFPELEKLDRYHPVDKWWDLLHHRKQYYISLAAPLGNVIFYSERELDFLKKELEVKWWRDAFYGGTLKNG